MMSAPGTFRSGSQTMIESDFDYEHFLPNLPMFRMPPKKKARSERHFDLIDGIIFTREGNATNASQYSLNASVDEGGSLMMDTVSRRRMPTQDFDIILTYVAWFEEFPPGLAKGQRQIRTVKIFYFLEDDTMKIVEKPQVNAGTSQGTIMRRSMATKPNGSPFSIFDLRVGEAIEIFKRAYHIVDCDAATRDYLTSMGFESVPAEPIPVDSYQKYRLSLQKEKVNIEKEWDKFHSKKNETKSYADAMMGVLVDNSGREGFMKFGKNTLNFKCVWDNTQQLFGDRLEFALSYFLADDTVQIVALPSSNSNSDQRRAKLMKRAKLPKDYVKAMTLGERPKAEEFFQWSDLYVGLTLNVFGRSLRLVDADPQTRGFYTDKNLPLGEPINYEPKQIAQPVREIPPPTGFGSEEDSMRSVSGSLMPGPVPAKKLGENKVLTFIAALKSGGVDDVDRRFVISYYVVDNTVKIAEPPVRNSGFSGGVFLSRREVKNEKKELLSYTYFYIGAHVQILKHRFLLLDAASSTLKWMEDQNLPRSNYYTIIDKIRIEAIDDAKSGELTRHFEVEGGAEGQATLETLRQVLSIYDLLGQSPTEISEHELRTIVRGAGNRRPTFDYKKLIDQIICPTDEFK